jgi:hypothetical protein
VLSPEIGEAFGESDMAKDRFSVAFLAGMANRSERRGYAMNERKRPENGWRRWG